MGEHADDVVEYRYQRESALSALVTAHRAGRMIGSLNIFGIDMNPFVDGIYVEPEDRRRGVATALWRVAVEHCPDLAHSSECTPVGYVWAKAVGGHLPTVTIVDPKRYLYDEVDVDADHAQHTVGHVV